MTVKIKDSSFFGLCNREIDANSEIVIPKHSISYLKRELEYSVVQPDRVVETNKYLDYFLTRYDNNKFHDKEQINSLKVKRGLIEILTGRKRSFYWEP